MKFWTAFCSLLLTVQYGFSGLAHREALNGWPPPDGKAYVTQSNQGSNSHEYDIHFGESWQSVRIFRLLEPLDQPLKVYVSSQPQNSALYKDSYRAYVGESLRMWNEALGGRLNFSYTKNRHDADITLDWVPAFPDPYVAGLTTYRVGHATIEIKTVGVPEADIKGNIIHEIGHALGISGHSNAPDDMMVGTRKWHRSGSTYSPQLSKRDVQAIQRLYSLTWKKGEDLYAAQAQAATVQSVASSKTNRQNLTLTPLDDTDLIHWKEAQSKETQSPALKPIYTQIFPNGSIHPEKP